MQNNKEYLQQFLDDSEVEEVLQQLGKGEYKDWTVIKYCKAFQLSSGTIRVPSYIIYMVYRRDFTGVANSGKIKPSAFFRTFKKLFTQVRSGKQRYYLLNTDFNLDSEVWDSHLDQYRKYYGKDKIR